MKYKPLTALLILLNFCLNAQTPEMLIIPGDSFSMGDHFGFVDPNHPSDELPIHSVKVDSFYMASTETTNQQFLTFLNTSLSAGLIQVSNNKVYLTGDTNIICYTNQFESWYSIGYSTSTFSITDFRANHPVVGVMWYGAAAYCNWLSAQNGLQPCYNTNTWECDFSKNGYRLPTEAEWEWAGRGGHKNPYLNYPTGNIADISATNLPNSGDPYETGSLPYTTPVGFYDGTLKQKSLFNWPGNAASYQTTNGVNGYGLYDMQGNVWELINDWYGQNYYSISPYDNPTGPTSGFIMPDGKQYKGMRGGNWYNGDMVSGVDDGHSRVSNRNPSYYRGPQDPNHPWYHVGFRIARKYENSGTGINDSFEELPFKLFQNFPNPFIKNTIISFTIQKPEKVSLMIYNSLGELITTLVNENLESGKHDYVWNAINYPCGIYSCKFEIENNVSTIQLILIK